MPRENKPRIGQYSVAAAADDVPSMAMKMLQAAFQSLAGGPAA